MSNTSMASYGNWVRTEKFEVPNTSIYLALAELFKKLDEDATD